LFDEASLSETAATAEENSCTLGVVLPLRRQCHFSLSLLPLLLTPFFPSSSLKLLSLAFFFLSRYAHA
jgi:hypothetical protein